MTHAAAAVTCKARGRCCLPASCRCWCQACPPLVAGQMRDYTQPTLKPWWAAVQEWRRRRHCCRTHCTPRDGPGASAPLLRAQVFPGPAHAARHQLQTTRRQPRPGGKGLAERSSSSGSSAAHSWLGCRRRRAAHAQLRACPPARPTYTQMAAPGAAGQEPPS